MDSHPLNVFFYPGHFGTIMTSSSTRGTVAARDGSDTDYEFGSQ
jgi:hypothetical protein